MKRIGAKNKQEQLKRRLELVRVTIRQLTPAQLELIKGGTDTADGSTEEPWCPPLPSF